MTADDHSDQAQTGTLEKTGSRTKVISISGVVEDGRLVSGGSFEGVSISIVGTISADNEVDAIVELEMDNTISESSHLPDSGDFGQGPIWGPRGPGAMRPAGGALGPGQQGIREPGSVVPGSPGRGQWNPRQRVSGAHGPVVVPDDSGAAGEQKEGDRGAPVE